MSTLRFADVGNFLVEMNFQPRVTHTVHVGAGRPAARASPIGLPPASPLGRLKCTSQQEPENMQNNVQYRVQNYIQKMQNKLV